MLHLFDIPETSLFEAGVFSLWNLSKPASTVLRLGAEGRQAVGIDHRWTARHLPLDSLPHGCLVIAAGLKRCFEPVEASVAQRVLHLKSTESRYIISQFMLFYVPMSNLLNHIKPIIQSWFQKKNMAFCPQVHQVSGRSVSTRPSPGRSVPSTSPKAWPRPALRTLQMPWPGREIPWSWAPGRWKISVMLPPKKLKMVHLYMMISIWRCVFTAVLWNTRGSNGQTCLLMIM